MQKMNFHLPQAVTQPQVSGFGAKSNNGASVFIPVNTKYALTTYDQLADYMGRSRSTVMEYRSSGKIPAHLIAPNRLIFFTDEIDAAIRVNPSLASSKTQPSITPSKPKPRKDPGMYVHCYLKPGQRMFIIFSYRSHQCTIACSPDRWNDATAIFALVDEVVEFREELRLSKTAAL